MDRKLCRLCVQPPRDPVMLVCAHNLCYNCAMKIQVLDSSSMIQGKYRIQCPDCRRQTYTYELQNLLVDTMELNLITDSSELDKEELHESQLSHNINRQPDAIFQRRISKIIDRQDIQQTSNSFSRVKQAIPLTPTHQPLNFQNPSSEKASPTRTTTPQIKSKKQSQQFDSSFGIFQFKPDPDDKCVLNTSQNNNIGLKAISGVSTPNSTPFQIGFNIPRSDHYLKLNEKENHTNDKKQHKRSSTGIPGTTSSNEENIQTQIITSYFGMLQKNIAHLQQDILYKLQKNKQYDANYLYTRLKRLSEKQKSKNDEDLVQQVKVIHELRNELSRKTEDNQPQYYNKSVHQQPTSAKPQYLQGKLL